MIWTSNIDGLCATQYRQLGNLCHLQVISVIRCNAVLMPAHHGSWQVCLAGWSLIVSQSGLPHGPRYQFTGSGCVTPLTTRVCAPKITLHSFVFLQTLKLTIITLHITQYVRVCNIIKLRFTLTMLCESFLNQQIKNVFVSKSNSLFDFPVYLRHCERSDAQMSSSVQGIQHLCISNIVYYTYKIPLE